MREDQNVVHQLGEIKEKGLDQLFHTLYSSCHSSLLSDVCIYACYCSTKSDYFLTYPPCFHMQESTEHCWWSLSPLEPLSVRTLSPICSSSSSSHPGGIGTKELPASFLQRVLLFVALFWNPDTKSILSKTLPWWLRQEKIIILLIYPKTYASEREWISIISYSGDKTLS